VRNIPWNKVVRRSVIEENDIRFLPIFLTEDIMYSLPAAVSARRIVRIARPLMFHREYTGTNLMSDRGKHPQDFLDAFEALRAWLRDRGVWDELRFAWQTWLIDAVHYAMPRYANAAAFVKAYGRLTADRLHAFDLHDVDVERIANPYHRRLYEALRTGSREQFLLTCANCGFEELEEEIRDWQRWQTPSGAALASAKEKLRTGSGPVSGAARQFRAKMR
jgi:glycosyltransferase EpsH